MPRVYFYLSGKCVPLTAIGGPDSRVGTKWINGFAAGADESLHVSKCFKALFRGSEATFSAIALRGTHCLSVFAWPKLF